MKWSSINSAMILLLGLVSTMGHATETLTRKHHVTPSPSEDLMFYHGFNQAGKTALYSAKLNGEDEQLFFGSHTFLAQEPRLSPDGKTLAFVSGNSYQAGSLGIYLIDADGANLRQVATSKQGNLKGPSWSPDGKKIAYDLRNRKNQLGQLFVYDLDSEKSTPVTKPEQGIFNQAEWSPDGKHLLATLRNAQGVGDLVLVPLRTPDKVAYLTKTDADETMPVWSPDGKTVVYSRGDETTQSYELFALNVHTKHSKALTQTSAQDEYFPIFSADGKTLYHGAMVMGKEAITSTIGRLEIKSL